MYFARYAKLAADRLDRLTMNKIGATDFRNRLHHQHPNLGFHDLMEATVDPCPGVPIGCRSPRKRGPYSMPKHIQRRAYGLRDEEYLRLKVLTCMLPPL